MIIDHNCVDIKGCKSQDEIERLQKGLCPKCGGESFRENVGRLSGHNWICNNGDCAWACRANAFKPRLVMN